MLLRLVSPGARGSGGTTGPWKEECGMRSHGFKAVRWNVWDVFCVRFQGTQEGGWLRGRPRQQSPVGSLQFVTVHREEPQVETPHPSNPGDLHLPVTP